MNDSLVPAIQLRHISKVFGEVRANHNISLDIFHGQVLALLGENGAGKSTLMSILAGQIQPTSGEILQNGSPTNFSDTNKAIQAGIGMVYQHFKLVEAMTVAENILLGDRRSWWLHHKAVDSRIEDLANQFGIHVSPDTRVSSLSMGERQQVEILKLLYRQSSILIFDEPTSVLTPTEAKQLFTIIEGMKRQGKAIIFISHKLDEVMRISDSIAILRRGEIVDQIATNTVSSTAELAERMVGRELLMSLEKEPIPFKQTVLKVETVTHGNLRNISLEIRQGEILGIVGVAGNGQKPLVELICGDDDPKSGSIKILGEFKKAYFKKKYHDVIMSYVPEDRQGMATCQQLDLVDNFLLTTRENFTRGLLLNKDLAREKTKWLVDMFSIRPNTTKALARHLSGGNLQKLVLAREFFRKPRLLIAEQPTQGLDIAATKDIWKLLLEAREGAGILLVTSDLTEALTLSDSIAVMFNHQFVDSFPVTETDKISKIPQMIAGLSVN